MDNKTNEFRGFLSYSHKAFTALKVGMPQIPRFWVLLGGLPQYEICSKEIETIK